MIPASAGSALRAPPTVTHITSLRDVGTRAMPAFNWEYAGIVIVARVPRAFLAGRGFFWYRIFTLINKEAQRYGYFHQRTVQRDTVLVENALSYNPRSVWYALGAPGSA